MPKFGNNAGTDIIFTLFKCIFSIFVEIVPRIKLPFLSEKYSILKFKNIMELKKIFKSSVKNNSCYLQRKINIDVHVLKTTMTEACITQGIYLLPCLSMSTKKKKKKNVADSFTMRFSVILNTNP